MNQLSLFDVQNKYSPAPFTVPLADQMHSESLEDNMELGDFPEKWVVSKNWWKGQRIIESLLYALIFLLAAR
jgi:hypothetical protein